MPKTNPITPPMSDEHQAENREALSRSIGSVLQSPSARDYAPLNRFMRVEEVLHVTGMSCSTLYRKIGSGTFPRQVALGANMVAWRESEVSDWLQNPT